jgi:hypothetical protein
MKATTSKKKGGRAILLFATKEDMKRVAGQTIDQRYKLAYSVPIMSNNKLLQDVDFTGNGEAVSAILSGTYKFPPETDPWTHLLLTEAAVLFCSLGKDSIEDWVKRQDFQKCWQTAWEANESSKSQLHFGHYKAGDSDNNIISELHAASLNTIREIGVAPDRCRQSITVLLEKVFGVHRIDKLRAICFLEADFNWLNKLIFAHRLEQHCRKHGLVSPEQFAKSRTTCEEASLDKNLVCNNSCILCNSLSPSQVSTWTSVLTGHKAPLQE